MGVLIKLFCGLLVMVVVVNAVPADRRNTEKLEKIELDKDSESESDEYPMKPLIPLDGFLSGFNDMFDRLRQQMLHLMSQVPIIGSPQGGNTTSVTKIIDGHKVIINETVYASPDGEDASAIFKVRVVDIRPDFSDESSEKPEGPAGPGGPPGGPKGSVESVEESQENEIPKNLRGAHAQKRKINAKDLYNTNALNHFKKLETFEYPINNNLETFDDIDSNIETFDVEPLGNSIETFDDEDLERTNIDLSNDILINKIAEMNGRPRNPNAEVFSFEAPRGVDLSRDTYINEIAEREGFPRNPNAEMVEHFPRMQPERIVPFGDLSRDTYVNEIAARRRVPFNADAEFVGIEPSNSRYYYRTHQDDS